MFYVTIQDNEGQQYSDFMAGPNPQVVEQYYKAEYPECQVISVNQVPEY